MGEYRNKIVGKAKKGVGRFTGNRSLQTRGTVQETGGKVQGGAKRLGRRIGRSVERGTERLSRSANKASSRRVGAGRPKRTMRRM